MTELKWDKNLAFIILLSLVAFIVYLIFPFRQVQLAEGERIIFNSPDETANYVFAESFARTGQLQIEPSSDYLTPAIHPRSVAQVNGQYVPTSFIGIDLLYGSLAKLVGPEAIVFLTPLFSAIALVFFYLLLRLIFDERIAMLSTVMLAFLPPFVYYTARSMFHNVLFLDLLIVSLYFTAAYLKELKVATLIGAVFFLVAAIVIRPSEILWVLPLYIGLVYIFRQAVRISLSLSLFLILGFLVYFPVFYFQTTLFEIPAATGYPGDPIALGVEVGRQSGALNGIATFLNQTIFPFGLHPRRATLTFFHYFIEFFWWLAIPVLLGLGWFVRRSEHKSQKIYFHTWLWPSLFLILFYGSWVIRDTVSAELYTIGTSYVRYLLPVYVFSIPVAAFAILRATRRIDHRWLRQTLVVGFVIIYAALSVNVTFIKSVESLFSVDQAIADFQTKANRVRRLVEPGAVIIAEKTDKVFWPEFDVISSIFNKSAQADLNLIATQRPLYYYTFLDEADVEQVNQSLASSTVELIDPVKIMDNEKLYRIVPLKI